MYFAVFPDDGIHLRTAKFTFRTAEFIFPDDGICFRTALAHAENGCPRKGGLKMVLLISVQNHSPFGRRPADPRKWAVRFFSDEGYHFVGIPRPNKISQPVLACPLDAVETGCAFGLI